MIDFEPLLRLKRALRRRNQSAAGEDALKFVA